MLSLFLLFAAANAAVIRNSTTRASLTRVVTSAITSVVTPEHRVQNVAAPDPSAAGAALAAAPGSWPYSFSEFRTVAPTVDPNPTITPDADLSTYTQLFPTMFPIYALSRLPERPFIGLQSPYANSFAQEEGHTHSDLNLKASCSTSFDQSLDPWLLTAPIGVSERFPVRTEFYTSPGFTGPTRASWSPIPGTFTTNGFERVVYSAVPTTITVAPKVHTVVHAEWSMWTYDTPFSYSASGACCWTCTIVGGTHVQVNYWPKTAEPTPVSTIVDEAGFTFVSPSIYIAFETLYATNLCGKTGPAYGATTLAFEPTELSTARAYRWDFEAYATAPPVVQQGKWTQADWGDQESCTNVEEEFYQHREHKTYSSLADLSKDVLYGSTTGQVPESDIHHYTVTWNNCSPSLSVPTEILDLNTDWKDCSQGFRGLYDPPYALKPKGALVPPTTTPAPISATSTPPSQGPTVAPPTPAATATKEPQQTPDSTQKPQAPPTKSPKPDPPVQTPKADPPADSTKPQDPPIDTPKPHSQPTKSPKPQDPPINTQKPQDPTNPPKSNNPPTESTKPQDPADTPKPNDPSTPTTEAGIIAIGSSTIIADPSSAFLIGGQTLAPGSQITVSGTTLSLATNGASIIINGTPEPITTVPIHRPTGFIIGSQTLQAGASAVTISGEEVSLATDAKSVVVAGTTRVLSAYLGTVTSTAVGLGEIIASFGGFGGGGKTTLVQVEPTETPGGNGAGVEFTGGASGRRRSGVEVWGMGILAGFGVLVVLVL